MPIRWETDPRVIYPGLCNIWPVSQTDLCRLRAAGFPEPPPPPPPPALPGAYTAKRGDDPTFADTRDAQIRAWKEQNLRFMQTAARPEEERTWLWQLGAGVLAGLLVWRIVR